MPPARTGIRHVRQLDDVALCGERGSQVRFAVGSGAGADCGVCKVRRQKAIDASKERALWAARMKALRAAAR
jgi:hypothetical protein